LKELKEKKSKDIIVAPDILPVPITVMLELSVATPDTRRVELNPTAPVTVNPVPTFKFPPTPSPPTIVKAPVVEDVD
jgi:hypothetical protein